jgi:hypothetical protein
MTEPDLAEEDVDALIGEALKVANEKLSSRSRLTIEEESNVR